MGARTKRPRAGAKLARSGIVLCLLAGATTMAPAQEDTSLFARVSEIPKLVAQRALDPRRIPNPHWRPDACHACHTAAPQLRDRDEVRLCNQCHDAVFDHSYIHPVGDKASGAMLERMPASYRAALGRTGNRVSCSTCHDVTAQCLSERRRERGLNPAFFRDGPFKPRTKQCYFCHESEQYQRLNPHQQTTAEGKIRPATCRLCHREKLEKLQSVRRIDELSFPGGRDLGRLCTRCHTWVPHPGTALHFGNKKRVADHLVKPTQKMASYMERKSQETGVVLPLEPKTGRIFCGTCHDPHEDGVIGDRPAPPAGGKSRLRSSEICRQCHEV